MTHLEGQLCNPVDLKEKCIKSLPNAFKEKGSLVLVVDHFLLEKLLLNSTSPVIISLFSFFLDVYFCLLYVIMTFIVLKYTNITFIILII
jgi:hypothetical protein